MRSAAWLPGCELEWRLNAHCPSEMDPFPRSGRSSSSLVPSPASRINVNNTGDVGLASSTCFGTHPDALNVTTVCKIGLAVPASMPLIHTTMDPARRSNTQVFSHQLLNKLGFMGSLTADSVASTDLAVDQSRQWKVSHLGRMAWHPMPKLELVRTGKYTGSIQETLDGLSNRLGRLGIGRFG